MEAMARDRRRRECRRRCHVIPATFDALPQHIRDQVVRSTCLDWVGRRNEKGYGLVWLDGRQQRAHRVVYELLVGSIPDGLVIDHLCRNRACVNPDHMEPVTVWENTRRGENFMARGQNPGVTRDLPPRPKRRPPSAKTECDHGHAMTPENTYTGPKGHRECRECRRLRHARDAVRRRELRASRASPTT
jgi:hypothetical protein